MKNKKPQNNKCTLYVNGMHCSSCEVLLEKKLIKKKGVTFADASLKESRVDIEYSGNKPDIKELNREFKDTGYVFSERKIRKPRLPLFTIEDGSIQVNQERFTNLTKVIIVTIFCLIGFILLINSGLAAKFSVNAKSNPPAYFVFGLFAGASTCAALVGGVVLSMSKQWNEVYIDDDNKLKKSIPHILFHTGRLVSFFLVGGIIAMIGSKLIDLFSTFSIIITVLVSLLMFVMAGQMLEWEFFEKFRLTTPKGISKYASNEENFKGKFMPFITGFVSFLIPCGLTLTAFSSSLASGNFLNGAIDMLSFALGTLVILGFISFSSIMFTNTPLIRANFNKVAGILIIFFAVFTLNSQVIAVNSRYNKNLPTLSSVTSIFKKDQTKIAENKGDVQIIEMKVTGSGFSPSRFQVKAGQQVEWRIDGTKASGCTGRIVGKGIFDGEVDIAGQTIVINFKIDKKGTYNFSCWMGMVNGSIEVI